MQIIADTNSTHFTRHLFQGLTDNDQLQAFLLHMTGEELRSRELTSVKITQ